MTESIASMHNLQALSYMSDESESGMASPLHQIKNLKHLDFRPHDSFSPLRGDVLRSLLQNSASTLRSLNHYGGLLDDRCFKETDDQGRPGDQWIEMTSLHTLRIRSISFLDTTPNFLRKAINLLKLRELEVGYFSLRSERALPLYSQLISAFGEAPDGAPPALRKLTLHLGDEGADALLPMRLLHSLDTLTSLSILNFGSVLNGPDPALSDMLQRVILKQKNLRCLNFVCNGLNSQGYPPYMPVKVARRFMKGLPDLREFEFALAIEDIVSRIAFLGSLCDPGICDPPLLLQYMCRVLTRIEVPLSRALLLGTNLERLTILTLQAYPTPHPEHVDVLSGILREYLAHGSEMDAMKRPEERSPFVWEHEFRLRQIDLNGNGVYNVGSVSGKPRKRPQNQKTARIHEFAQGDQYRVLCRKAAEPTSVYFGSGPEPVWLEQVQKDLD